MRDDFRSALARVQSDYAFYIQCQSDGAAALADYELSPEERAALRDPELLAAALKIDNDAMRIPSITIKISGTHDWVNRTLPKKKEVADELIAREVEAILRADGDQERADSTLRLIQLLG